MSWKKPGGPPGENPRATVYRNFIPRALSSQNSAAETRSRDRYRFNVQKYAIKRTKITRSVAMRKVTAAKMARAITLHTHKRFTTILTLPPFFIVMHYPAKCTSLSPSSKNKFCSRWTRMEMDTCNINRILLHIIFFTCDRNV